MTNKTNVPSVAEDLEILASEDLVNAEPISDEDLRKLRDGGLSEAAQEALRDRISLDPEVADRFLAMVSG